MKFDLNKASKKLCELDLKITTENIMMDVLWFRSMHTEQAQIISRHMHSTYEFHFIVSGCYAITLDGGCFEAAAGEFYLTAPGVCHEQKDISTGGSVEYCINCDFKAIDNKPTESQLILKILKDTPCMPFKDLNGCSELFEKALKEAYYQNIGYYNSITSLATMIVFTAARTMSKNLQYEYDIPIKNKKNDYRILQIERYIRDNIANPLTTKDIARYMYLSDKQVCRVIEEEKGFSTKQFIAFIKLEKAKELLSGSNLSLKQISANLGFSSEHYFNQFFKREEGYPPGMFRRSVKNV